MCARPYRLVELENEKATTTVVVYEVDSDASLLEKKRLALENAGWHSVVTRVVSVQADLAGAASTAEALQRAGLDSDIRTDGSRRVCWNT
jgi:Leucine carboxyl methyltransferase